MVNQRNRESKMKNKSGMPQIEDNFETVRDLYSFNDAYETVSKYSVEHEAYLYLCNYYTCGVKKSMSLKAAIKQMEKWENNVLAWERMKK